MHFNVSLKIRNKLNSVFNMITNYKHHLKRQARTKQGRSQVQSKKKLYKITRQSQKYANDNREKTYFKSKKKVPKTTRQPYSPVITTNDTLAFHWCS